MNKADNTIDSPTKGIWRRFLILIPLVVVLFACSYFHIRSVCSTYHVWTPVSGMWELNYDGFDTDDITYDVPGVVELVSVEHGRGGAARLTFKALKDGSTVATFGDQSINTMLSLEVRDGAIIEGHANFEGWEAIHLSICIFFGVMVVLFGSVLLHLVKETWYGYDMVASGGGLMFCLFQFAFFTFLLLHSSLRNFSDLAFQVSGMADWFIMISTWPLGLMALLVSLSNISLIRHEGRRPINLLGIAVSVMWFVATYIWFNFWNLDLHLALGVQMTELLSSAFAVGIVFGECMLLSTILCAWSASCHEPQRHFDYVVILGCGLRPDGTPCPLLIGRIERALGFDKKRIEMGETPAVFVPSGGQGPDEVISEAQSMGNYLLGQGVPEERLALEDRSSTTRENMAFSREVIERHAGRDVSEVSVGFSTTNYHVFRGYVCAQQAGMRVEGMGSKTKAYFWPNAFLREFAGLLVTEWKGILQTYAIIAFIYLLAEYILTM